jgi:T5SS/PEP-CTERM-associated repeat protein
MKRFHPLGFLLLASLLALATPAAATTRTWTGATDDDWFTASNWNPSGAPSPADTLSVYSGTPTTTSTVYIYNGGQILVSGASASPSLGSLYLAQQGNGQLDVTSSGDLSTRTAYVGYGTGAVGTANITGSGSTWDMGVYDMFIGYAGTGNVNVQSGASITSSAGYLGFTASAVGNVTLDGSESSWYAGTGDVVVGRYGTGTLEVNNGADVLDASALVVGWYGGSTGTTTVDGYGSTIDVGIGGVHVGYEDGAVGTLNISNGGLVATSGPLGIGLQGTVNLSSGKLSAGSISSAPANSLNFTGGELELTAGGLDISGSSPLGSYLNMVTGQFLDVYGDLNVASGSTLDVNDASVQSGTFTNEGNLYLIPGGSLSYGGTGLFNRSYMSMSGGTVTGTTFTNDYGAMLSGRGSIQAVLANKGTLSVSDVLTVTDYIMNYGTIDVNYAGDSLRQDVGLANYGSIELDGGSIAGTGSVTNHAGGIIRGGSSIGSELTNDGGLIHADGASTLLISDLSGGNINGGELRIDDGAGINVLTSFSNAGSVVLEGADALLAGGAITNTGTVAGSGRVSNSLGNGGTLRASGGMLTLSGAGLTNSGGGRIEALADGTVFVSQGLATNDGTIALQGGGFDNNGNAMTNSGSITGHGVLRTGGLTNSNHIGVGVSDLEVLGDVANNGSVDIQSGATAVFYDDVSGSGSFDGLGTAMFLGSLHPGSSPGTMSFAGNLVLGGGASLEIELGGTEAGVDHDLIEVALGISLDGTLDVVLLGDFAPENGDLFDILDFDPLHLSGAFDSIHLPGLSEGLFWNTSALYTSGAITVVPEPSTLGLLALGCLLLAGIRRSGR